MIIMKMTNIIQALSVFMMVIPMIMTTMAFPFIIKNTCLIQAHPPSLKQCPHMGTPNPHTFIHCYRNILTIISFQFQINLSGQFLTKASQSSWRHLDRLWPAEPPAEISIWVESENLIESEMEIEKSEGEMESESGRIVASGATC